MFSWPNHSDLRITGKIFTCCWTWVELMPIQNWNKGHWMLVSAGTGVNGLKSALRFIASPLVSQSNSASSRPADVWKSRAARNKRIIHYCRQLEFCALNSAFLNPNSAVFGQDSKELATQKVTVRNLKTVVHFKTNWECWVSFVTQCCFWLQVY